MYESRNIDDLRPDVAKNARKFIELCGAAGLPVSISSTVRDQEKQTEYYNKGTGSKTVSFHSVGSGLAFDIYHTEKGYDDIEFFKDCAKIGKEMGFEWGGDWTSLVDMPHFQWSENGKYTSSDIIAGRVPKEMPEYTESQGANTPTLNNSKYLVDSVTKGWLSSWVKQGFLRKGKPVPNTDLWKRLLVLLDRHQVSFIWVKGHAENEFNNRCDELAVAQWKSIRSSL